MVDGFCVLVGGRQWAVGGRGARNQSNSRAHCALWSAGRPAGHRAQALGRRCLAAGPVRLADRGEAMRRPSAQKDRRHRACRAAERIADQRWISRNRCSNLQPDCRRVVRERSSSLLRWQRHTRRVTTACSLQQQYSTKPSGMLCWPCLVHPEIQKIIKISRHIKSYGTYMKH